MRPALLALTVLLAAPPAALAQDAPAQDSTLYVGVQRPDGEPVVGATVRVGERGASTDVEGQTAFEGAGPGEHTVGVSFVGSPPVEFVVELTAPGPWGLVVNLEDATGLLGGVVVEGERLDRSRMARDGFFRRQRAGFGTVLTAEDLDRRAAVFLSDALQGVVGVRTLRGPAGGAAAVSTRGGCRMAVFLDGFYAPDLTADLDGLPLQDVAAIEVYNGSQVPIQYQVAGRRGSGCGAVLVWTQFSATNPR